MKPLWTKYVKCNVEQICSHTVHMATRNKKLQQQDAENQADSTSETDTLQQKWPITPKQTTASENGPQNYHTKIIDFLLQMIYLTANVDWSLWEASFLIVFGTPTVDIVIILCPICTSLKNKKDPPKFSWYSKPIGKWNSNTPSIPYCWSCLENSTF